MIYFLVFQQHRGKECKISAFDNLQAAVKGLKAAEFFCYHEKEMAELLSASPSANELANFFDKNGPSATVKGHIFPSMYAQMVKYTNRTIESEMPYLTDNLEDARRMAAKYKPTPKIRFTLALLKRRERKRLAGTINYSFLNQ